MIVETCPVDQLLGHSRTNHPVSNFDHVGIHILGADVYQGVEILQMPPEGMKQREVLYIELDQDNNLNIANSPARLFAA